MAREWDEHEQTPGKRAATVEAGPASNSNFHQPLINYATNNWERQPQQQSRSASAFSSKSPFADWHRSPWLAFLFSIVFAPKFRRSLMLSAVVLALVYIGWETLFVQSAMQEPQVIMEPLGNVEDAMRRAGRWAVTNVRPEFADFVPMKTLDPSRLPSYERSRFKHSKRRLVFIGDVHGCQDELEQLLKKVAFDHTAGDHLIFTGDMITKGPHSAGVVDIARSVNASCVRGNDEDRILLQRSDLKYRNILESEIFNEFDIPHYTPEDRSIARSLDDDQAAWLHDCPAILKIGPIKDMGEVVVVHGGLSPGIPPENQDLLSVMSMNGIDPWTHMPTPKKRKGTPWFQLYNEYYTLLALGQLPSRPANAQVTTVIYGHDTTETYNIRPYTKGLDSGCVQGRELTALVIEDGGVNKVVQVKCSKSCGSSSVEGLY